MNSFIAITVLVSAASTLRMAHRSLIRRDSAIRFSQVASEFKTNGDNNLQGGNSVFGGAQFWQKLENFQWAFEVQYRRNF